MQCILHNNALKWWGCVTAMLKFISLLGTSAYVPCNYFIKGREDVKARDCRYVQKAILDILKQEDIVPDEIIIFTTNDAYKTNWKNDKWPGLEDVLIKYKEETGTEFRNVRIPNGAKEEDLWEIFKIILDELDENDEIIFDITHSFRYLPMLVFIIINYARVIKNCRLNSIYYGAFEVLGSTRQASNIPIDERNAPIFDLTSFVDLFDWTMGIYRYLNTGDASIIHELTKTQIKRINAQKLKKLAEQDVEPKTLFMDSKQLSELANSMKEFSDAVFTCRGLMLTQVTCKLKESLDTVLESASKQRIIPLMPVLEKMKERFDKFSKDNPYINIIETARWCADNRMYQQGLTILEEGLISYACEKLGYINQVQLTKKENRDKISSYAIVISNEFGKNGNKNTENIPLLNIKPNDLSDILKVLILYTNQSLCLLDDVIEFTKLKPSQYTTTQIDSENPLQLYQEIKNTYEKWNRPKNIFVDFTGGTKSMSAGCAMAGVAIKAKLVYIAGDYIKSLRKPEPGSEQLLIVDDPYTDFGDLDREQAVALFNNMDYTSAYRIFDELDQRTNTKDYGALKYLSKAYESWDSLDIDGAISNMSKCIEITSIVEKLNKKFILAEYKDVLCRQIEVLQVLREIHNNNKSLEHKAVVFDNIGYLIANLYQNALRREKQGKYEMASLLFYRILETIEQKRLWNFGIDTSNADYSNLSIDKESLLLKTNNIRARIYNSGRNEQLDNKISLLAGYILLAALGDDIIKANKPGKEIDLLKNLRNKVDARNNSIFAHGYEFIDDKKYNDFKKVVVGYIDKFFEIEKIDKEDLFDACKFIAL